MRRLIAQFGKFGAVGLVGLVIDFGVFNLLRATVLSPDSLHEGPFLAKVISTSLAIVANWLGNRHWTFRAQRGRSTVNEGLAFLVVSLGGMLIGLGCLWISHYALGFTSALADNISANVVGLALGTAFRFWLYRSWVFAGVEGGADAAADAAGTAGAAATGSASGAPESPVVPAGRAPRDRVEAVAAVDQGGVRHH